MTGKEIILAVKLTSKTGKESDLSSLCTWLLPQSRSEEGCILYNFHSLNDDPQGFMFYEIWKDQAAFDFHNGTPYLAEFREKLGDLVAADPEVTFLTQLEG